MNTRKTKMPLKLLVASLAASSLISFNVNAADEDKQLLKMKSDANIENRSADKSAVLPQTKEASADNWQSNNDSSTDMQQNESMENDMSDNYATSMSETLHFEFDSTNLTPESESTLEGLKDKLDNRENLKADVEITGYADATGPEEYNMHLSQQRAEAIKSELQGLGVTVSDWNLEGHGEESPVADNNTREGRAENRRVEINISMEPEEKVSAADM